MNNCNSSESEEVHLENLVTETSNPLTADIDSLSTKQILKLINDEDHRVADAVKTELPAIAGAVDIIVSALRKGGRLIYVGCGTSGRLGVLDAAECPVNFGIAENTIIGVIAGGSDALVGSQEELEDSYDQPAEDLKNVHISEKDVVVSLAASGRTPYAVGAIRFAKSVGCRTVGVSNNPNSDLARLAHIPITAVTGPEVLTGSTRLKAGSAQKMILNMLSTAAMIKLGKCYGNLMVDLHGSACEKLKDRSKRIMCTVTGCDCTRAVELLEQTNYEVKPAILMEIAQVELDKARELLNNAQGSLKTALAERMSPNA